MKELEQPASEIYSSTGKLGEGPRQFDRIYRNHPGLIIDSNIVRYHMRRMSEKLGQDDVSRVVFRGVITEEVLKEVLLDEGLHNKVEALIPLDELGFKEKWLIMMGQNTCNRTVFNTNKIIGETEEYAPVVRTSDERLRSLEKNGFLINRTTEGKEAQVASLWGHAFGWTLQEVQTLSDRLQEQLDLNPEDRNLWVSVVTKGDEVITAAMAERLRIPIGDNFLDLVENTEWKTKEGFEGQGLMTATLVDLNMQIVSDMDSNGIPSLIFAECNFVSRSDRAGHGAGFVVPPRIVFGNIIPQVLMQNVEVEGKMVDFTCMMLPEESKIEYYSNLITITKGGVYEYSSNLF